MQIETARMIIRRFTLDDAQDLYEILGDNQAMEFCEKAYSFEKTKEFLSSFCIEQKGAFAAVHKENRKVIGYLLFKELESGCYEMGWIFNRRYWNQGFAFESCHTLIEYAFHHLNAHKIFAETIDSVKSTNLMKKLGMKLDEIQKNQVKDQFGNWTDMHFYSISSKG